MNPEAIIEIVAKEFHVTVEEMVSKNSKHHVCDARNTAMCLISLYNRKMAQRLIVAYFSDRKDFFSVYRRARENVDALLRTDRIFKLRFEICKLLIDKIQPKRAYTKHT